MSILDIITVVLFIIGSPLILITYFNFSKISSSVQTGKYPQFIIDFPICETTHNHYLRTKGKVDVFSNLAIENQEAELKLNEFEINTLYTKGIVVNKYLPGRYYYYCLKSDSIIRKMLVWPSFNLSGYQLWSRRIKFAKKNDCLKEVSLGLEGFPKPKEEDAMTVDISRAPLVLFIFGISISPICYITSGIEPNEYEKVVSIISKLKDIEIKDGFLILRT